MLKALTLACLVASAMAASEFQVQIRPRANNSYPPTFVTPPKSMTPKEWTDAMNAAIAAGKIPNIPVATNQNGNPTYPSNADNNAICSWTNNKCTSKTDIVNAPDGTLIVGFDDGPTSVSKDLYDFLRQNNQSATHYMIGSNVHQYQQQFQEALAEGNQQFAVHTWSHQLMTCFDNDQVLAELGWTMQIIADMSGGYIPKFWRPPQGDVDNRVRAIAEEVFGLTCVLWNQDTNDWCLNDQGGTACPDETPGKDYESVASSVQPWIHGPKSPGLIILEHELSHASISVFKNYYPSLKGLGWKTHNLAEAFQLPWYKNARGPQDKPIKGGMTQNFDLSSIAANSGNSSGPHHSSSTSPSHPASAQHATSDATRLSSTGIAIVGLSLAASTVGLLL